MIPLADSSCTFCGQCVNVCPVGAIVGVSYTKKVMAAIHDPKKTVVVQTAPAVRVAIGQEFGFKPGEPVTGKLVAALRMLGFDKVLFGGIGCALLAVVLIKLVTFPFRAPEEGVHVASFDRFLLSHGEALFTNLLLVSITMGLVLSLPLEVLFYALMMGGFLLALLAQRFVFRNAELKAEVVSGLILMLAALLVLLVAPMSPVAPLLMGLSVGIIGSRFLLFFIKLSRHCQRGTSQSTFFLSWETGIALGVGLGYAAFYGQHDTLLYVCLALTVVALLMYHFFTHQWFLTHKNR
jgi:ferredoxin